MSVHSNIKLSVKNTLIKLSGRYKTPFSSDDIVISFTHSQTLPRDRQLKIAHVTEHPQSAQTNHA